MLHLLFELGFLILIAFAFLVAFRIRSRRHMGEEFLLREAAKQGEERFLSLFRNMAEGVVLHELLFDAEGHPVNYRIIDVNPQFERIMGTGRDQVVGRLATEAYQTSEAPYLSEYAKVVQTRNPLQFETYFAPMERHFDISVAPWGEKGFATIFTDITERKKGEEALRKSEERLRLVLDGSNDAFWDWNLVTGEVVASPRWWEMLGVDPGSNVDILIADTFGNRPGGVGDVGSIHPDDREESGKRFMDHAEGKSPVYYSEHRVMTASGKYRWVLDRAKIVERDATGKPTRVAGTHSDITDRKQAEEK